MRESEPDDDTFPCAQPAGHAQPGDLMDRLGLAVRQRLDRMAGVPLNGFVCSDLPAVQVALQRVLDADLARGTVFCEWGSGLGAVCAVASSLSYEAYGIEIQNTLVEAARELLDELDLDATFAHGSFLLPGDEALVVDCDNTNAEASLDAYRELDLTPGDCDVVFAYPWPGEEELHDLVFARHATPGALLLTYHENSRVLVQRHRGAGQELEAVEWIG